MLVRVRINGRGTKGSPLIINLPNYKLVALDVETGIALVEIPDDDLPDDERIKAHLSMTQLLTDRPAPTMPAAYKSAWHRLLDRKYREHEGIFRPPLA